MSNTQDPALGPDGQTPATEGGQQQTPDAPKVSPELQKRFDEMTAQYREAQRRADEQALLNQQLTAQLLQNRQPAPQAPQAPQFVVPEGVDPGTAAMMKSMHDAFNAQFKAQQEQMQAMMQQTTQGMRMTTAQMQLEQQLQGQPPQVQQRARQLFDQWQKAGIGHVFSPTDPITFARGELGVPAPQQGRPLMPQAGSTFSPMTPGGGAGVPNPAGQQQGPGERLPDAVVERMNPAARLAYEEGRMKKWGNGDVNVPLVYD